MEKHYNPQQAEAFCQKIWRNHLAHFNQFDPQAPTFSVPLPPPNVTGNLHLGHAFQLTLMDILVRYHKMLGYNVHWQGGTDHAGIATQLVVEQNLRERGIQKSDLSQAQFLDAVWKWKEASGNSIFQQMQRLGVSLEEKGFRFTLDDDYCQAVQEAFVSLHQAGLIYRQIRLVNWDPKLQTALSDLEVKPKTQTGHLWYIRYPTLQPKKGQPEAVTVATTRPETLFGDVAVAVHPDDPRYQSLIGMQLQLPFSNRTIPIIADDTVTPSFGTGAVKITPAHDFADARRAQQQGLGFIQIFDTHARLLTQAEYFDPVGHKISDMHGFIPEALHGLDRFSAREKVIQMLADHQLLASVEAHTAEIPVGERSGSVIEPRLTQQWFLNVQKMAKSAIHAVQSGEIIFVPKMYEKQYFKWLENIENWCLSRQVWWGHPIPAWYDVSGNIYVGKNEQEIRQRYQLSHDIHLRPDPDVLDTWFSSSLWTFASLGWPQSQEKLCRYHPTSLVITGFDIIFFWVARMIMLTLELPCGPKQVPFRHVYVSGLIRDEAGQKMSKSKGNVLDPIDMIDGIGAEELVRKRTKHLLQPDLKNRVELLTRKAFPQGIAPHGSDAVRLTLSALAVQGRDIHWDMQRLNGFRNFCDKIWNAGRFIFMQLEEGDLFLKNLSKVETIIVSLENFPLHQWMQATFNGFLKAYQAHLQSFRFDLATQLLQHLVWHQFCDWYLEYAKPLLGQAQQEMNLKVRVSLSIHFEQLLRICHPTLPFLSEYLWQQLGQKVKHWRPYPKSILMTAFPKAQYCAQPIDGILGYMQRIQDIITAIRQFRSEYEITPKTSLVCYLDIAPDPDFELFLPFAQHQANLTACHLSHPPIENLKIGFKWFKIPVADACNLYVQVAFKALAGYQEKQTKKLHLLLQQQQALRNRLSNALFLERAPPSIVDQQRQQEAAYLLNIEQIKAALDLLNAEHI